MFETCDPFRLHSKREVKAAYGSSSISSKDDDCSKAYGCRRSKAARN